MFTPETSRHFTPYTDPQSGVVSYILKNETAPLQKMVYYVSKNWSHDGRYFWIVCAFPLRRLWHSIIPRELKSDVSFVIEI